MNRFSKGMSGRCFFFLACLTRNVPDIDNVDNALIGASVSSDIRGYSLNICVDALRMFTNTFSSIIGAIILITILLPWFLIPVLCISIAYIYIAYFYRASARELKVSLFCLHFPFSSC
jgi:hypothetical protein